MNARLFALAGSLLIVTAASAAEETTPKSSAREALRARIAEDAKKAEAAAKTSGAAKPAAPAKESDSTATERAATTAPAPTAPVAKAPAKTNAPAKDAAKEKPTVLPKVEVKKGRITELDQQLAKQEQDIAREKKNLKSSEVDSALNDAKIARPLAIFGGDSTQFRTGVAAERVELMEAEKDIMEAIAHAKTKEEKAELKKQLDQLKAMRRELDKSMR